MTAASELLSLADYERAARELVSPAALGVTRPHPVLVAPTAFQRLVHPDGEVGTARAAAATGTVMCVSTLASAGPATVAQAVPHGTRAVAAGEGLRPADYSGLIEPDLRWSDIAQLAADCPLPVLVKGILTAEDAELAIAHGVAGVIVSNHGGRQLDTVISGADALPEVTDAVGGRIDVLVDGGIRRGTDVVKALALGAAAVLVGRPVTYGLAVAGAAGAQRVLEILLAEVQNTLALIGCPRAADLNRGFVTPAPWAVMAR